VHNLGATVRLEDGSLAAIPAPELAAHRPTFIQSLQQRQALTLSVEDHGRHPIAMLAKSARPDQAPSAPELRLIDPAFEERMAAYLKATEEWAPPDRPPPAERHFIRKKRRAAYFEGRGKS
jgi:hypothetical protein